MKEERTQVLVIGSGAGGAVTAYELAAAGMAVLVLEEGPQVRTDRMENGSPEAIRRLYRKRGMTPIIGPAPIGFVEGCCVGGSTEINSGVWHRVSPDILLLWQARYGLADADMSLLIPHYEWAEKLCGVRTSNEEWCASTRLMNLGMERLEWHGMEVKRTTANPMGDGADDHETHDTPYLSGSMSRTLLPMAQKMGAQVKYDSRVLQILKHGNRVTGAVIAKRLPDQMESIVTIKADAVFVCAGVTETPALLWRSGIRHRVGNTLCIHPMLKVVARFPEIVDAHKSSIPLIQVKEFWPDISLGGAHFTPGHLALMIGDNWQKANRLMQELRHCAAYYIAVRGSGHGSVRPSYLNDYDTTIRYRLSAEDVANLSKGLARLSTLLLMADAKEILPCVHDMEPIRSKGEAIRWLDDRLPIAALNLTTVHSFSTCPMGEKEELCAADSFGKVFGYKNLHINDGSMLPDSPGVNPQGIIMALARRNAQYFKEQSR